MTIPPRTQQLLTLLWLVGCFYLALRGLQAYLFLGAWLFLLLRAEHGEKWKRRRAERQAWKALCKKYHRTD